MGKKMSWEQGLAAGRIPALDDIFNSGNKYGYRLNVNRRLIRPMYERYKEKLGEKILSDTQRLMFEAEVLAFIEKGKR